MKLPSVKKLALALQPVKKEATKCDDSFIIVRVQVLEDSSFKVHTGDMDPEEDHEGFWGSDYIDDCSDLNVVAKDILEEIMDHLMIHGFLNK